MDIEELMYDDGEDVVNDNLQEPDNQLDSEGSLINPSEEETSALEDYLKSTGISDIHKIKFEQEDGSQEELDWNDLSKEEQLNILKSNLSNPELDLDDEEIDLINNIRLSRMSPKQYLNSLQPVVNQQVVEPSYVVDDLSDDELFLLDLQTRIGLEDPSEDDVQKLQNALEKAKEDPDLFEKQIQGLRNEYKTLEEEKNAREQAEQEQQLNQQYAQFSNNIINSISNLTNIGDLDINLENDDMDQLASFILDRDETGLSYFARALNNPDDLVRMAWFTLNGEDVLNSISDYYKKLITQASKSSYQKGFEDAKKGNKPQVAIKNNKLNNNKQLAVQSILDITY